MFRWFGSRSKENSYYVVLVKANESNSLERLVRPCPLLIDLPCPAVAAVKGMPIEFRECCGLSALDPMAFVRQMADSSFSD